MALTSDSVNPKKPAADKPQADKVDDAKSLPDLVAAPGATDPAVHQLLAEQQTAVSNGDADAIREINAKLNELGYK